MRNSTPQKLTPKVILPIIVWLSKVTLEVAPGKNLTFYVHNDDASTLLEKVDTTFQENIKNHTFLVSENSIEKDIHD